MVVHRWVAFVLVSALLLGVGMRYPILQPYLYTMVPWVFILWAFILLWWDGQKTWSYGIFVFSVLALSYVIFVIGVRSGFPFGEIVYGSTLGQKIEGVPLSLSFLCLSLVLATACFARMITRQTFFAIVGGGFQHSYFCYFHRICGYKAFFMALEQSQSTSAVAVLYWMDGHGYFVPLFVP